MQNLKYTETEVYKEAQASLHTLHWIPELSKNRDRQVKKIDIAESNDSSPTENYIGDIYRNIIHQKYKFDTLFVADWSNNRRQTTMKRKRLLS